ncbi:MAG: 5-methyltetrahydropteroyltriglutamate--homocysteine S-methyltransferase [Candidatus Ancillula sp.]|jgi:5-methyltetrahydropteroyltriglutamate--homocysteine methyltransferase|nr:5-methyltetrahydropteroyltriglutamate--homocysteine S-methyltransferase [Candidatus Ancillula sp.]
MSTTFPKATILGYPRIGRHRELKKLEEGYWSGKIDRAEFDAETKKLRISTYKHLVSLGLDEDYSIPQSFSFYDQVLDAATTFGIIPQRFSGLLQKNVTEFSTAGDGADRQPESFGERMRRPIESSIDIQGYFTIARGDVTRGVDGLPGEMTKWFDTNYHYIVPEFHADTKVTLTSTTIIDQFLEAKAAGVTVRPQIVGPATLLALSKYDGVTPEQFVHDIVSVYCKLMTQLAQAGAEWIQLDEPALVCETCPLSNSETWEIAKKVYAEFALLSVENDERPNIFVTTPYSGSFNYTDRVSSLPVEAVHFDLVNAADDQEFNALTGKVFVAGVVDGHNIWRTDLEKVALRLAQLPQKAGAESFSVGSSCSLQHVPHTLEDEVKLGDALKSNLSFADEKIEEILVLAGKTDDTRAGAATLDGRDIPEVSERLKGLHDSDFERESIQERKLAQKHKLNLPLLPTTTIGSFPQTVEIRKARAAFKKGELSEAEYDQAMQNEIKSCVELQENLGIDVLVHGEAERNDMVQYFAENFEGFAVTENGWVQSYGSRCTKPSILWGDVWRKKPFTVKWSTYAQSLTDKPMKGMLTGPVTIMAWSFVRSDVTKSEVANQVALALRDEIIDLETAGIGIIQVDEPALRELLPLRKDQQAEYLDWSVSAFKLATSGVRVETQIHTHLCYSEFEVVLPAIVALNADVTSIEAARSKMEIVTGLVQAKYPLGVGPGVYDIHSPRVPTEQEIEELLDFAVSEFERGGLPISDFWVNPDCGLKTRKDAESTPSLKNMVAATLKVRAKL